MQTRREALMDEEYEVVQQINESNRRIVLCRQYAKAPELTVELLDSLIQKIVIHGDKKICVHFKYDNECYKSKSFFLMSMPLIGVKRENRQSKLTGSGILSAVLLKWVFLKESTC